MTHQIAQQINYLCDTVPQQLREIAAEDFEKKLSAEKWSKKELLGHLIDSATNNHQRFVRIPFEDDPVIFYAQNDWVSVQHYQSENTEQLIALWEIYNRHLAHVITHIPTQALTRTAIGKDGGRLSLEFLITDYVQHLEYHVNQLLPG